MKNKTKVSLVKFLLPLDPVHPAEIQTSSQRISGWHAEQKDIMYRRSSESLLLTVPCSFTYFCLVADERPPRLF